MAAADRRRVFLDQARSAAGRSPLYDRLWRRLADEPLVDALVDEWEWDTPLKVVGGLHYLVLAGRASWDDVDRALVDEREFLRGYVAAQGIQTNEVQRSWLLVPCLLEAARRLGAEEVDVVELGPSAGLNLLFDRYRYTYANGTWGDPAAPLELRGEERRPVPAALLERQLRVRSHVGLDRAPLDASTDEGALLLKSFVWPDMTERLERLDRALEVLRRNPPRIVRGDLVEGLGPVLEGEGPLLVFETMVLVYVPAEGRRRIYEQLAAAGERRPVAFVRSAADPDDATYSRLDLQLWPGGAHETLAHADFHGAWLDWLVRG